jgi:hypothetical protein
MENVKTNLELDLTSMNIFDSLKVMVLSSAKNPEYKVKCKGASDDVKSLVSSFEVRNLEFV